VAVPGPGAGATAGNHAVLPCHGPPAVAGNGRRGREAGESRERDRPAPVSRRRASGAPAVRVRVALGKHTDRERGDRGAGLDRACRGSGVRAYPPRRAPLEGEE